MRKSFEKFRERQENLVRQYGKEYEEKQHNRGKLTARERILLLFDTGTFEEVDAKLKNIMVNICHNMDDAAKRYGMEGNYVAGANIAGFEKVVDAMTAQGIV